MNTILPDLKESFTVGKGNLAEFADKLVKVEFGILLFCERGEATFSLELNEYKIVHNTNIIVIPRTIISIKDASPDFEIRYFIFSVDMFRKACFMLDPAFFQFGAANPCFTPDDLGFHPLVHLISAVEALYHDHQNRFREDIAFNLLQVFIWNAYDKLLRYTKTPQAEGGDRKREIFKNFINLVRENCTSQRDVGWYADMLFISSRYLATIVRDVTKHATAKDIIDRFLVLEIKATLQSTNLSIKEIADNLNFPDQSFFGRYFKKHTGISPKEYRQKVGFQKIV